MTAILPATQTFKDNPHPPSRIRWISTKARVSWHHAEAIDALLFERGAEMSKRKSFSVVVRILPDGQPMTIAGRDGWALNELYVAGKAGCTPIDNPGPRWSHYVFKLRRMGFDIETLDETHGGQFRGTHARYVLRSSISLVIKDEDDARAAA